MSKTLRIGTRESELALWQARTVQNRLEKLGHKTQLVPVKTTGDLMQDKPLYEMGLTGVFTKALDSAMLNGEVDIAVHSMKDVPTLLPKGITQTAVLERASWEDVLVFRENWPAVQKRIPKTIATGSLRRKAQWLNKYPEDTITGLRGNINTRLQKLQEGDWDGAIFAKAGLERIGLLPQNHEVLNWMLPAPAQGAMVVVALIGDDYSKEATSKLNHEYSDICTRIERGFLRVLEGGCTAPIGALATIEGNIIHFKGGLFSLDGTQKIMEETRFSLKDHQKQGERAATSLLSRGGTKLMREIEQNRNT